jgi:hypothetical protein
MKSSISIIFVIGAIFATLVVSEATVTVLFTGFILRERFGPIFESLAQNAGIEPGYQELLGAIDKAVQLVHTRLGLGTRRLQNDTEHPEWYDRLDSIRGEFEKIEDVLKGGNDRIEHDLAISGLRALVLIIQSNFDDAKKVINASIQEYPSYEKVLARVEAGLYLKSLRRDTVSVHFILLGSAMVLKP